MKEFLTSCEPESLDIGFDELPALKSIPETERARFGLSEDGNESGTAEHGGEFFFDGVAVG